MVELGFGGSIGLGFNGGDVRSVIKNATKDVNMSDSKDKTIMSKNEIDNKKATEKVSQSKNKVVPSVGGIPGVGDIINNNIGGTKNNGVDLNKYRGNELVKSDNKSDNVKTNTEKTEKSVPVDVLGQNNFYGVEGLTKDVQGIKGTMVTPEQMQKQREQINLRKEQTATALSAFDDLVQSIDGSIKRGEEDRITIENIRRAFPEFESLDESQINDLVRGIYNANKLGNEFSLYDYAVKHPELYIEFNSGKDLGINGKADLLEAMFSPDEGTYERPGLLKILTAGLAPSELGTLDTVSYEDRESGKEGKTFLQNAYKSLWNAVALTYNFINHPYESIKGLGNMILSFGTSRALKKSAEEAGMDRDEYVNMLIDQMGDGTSFKDKFTKWLVNSGNMGELTRDYFRTTYGTADGLANYIYSDPAGVISDVVSLMEAGVGLAGKAGLLEKSAVKSTMKTLSWLDPYQAPGKVLMGSDDAIKIGGKQIKNVGLIPELAKIDGKLAKGALKTTGKVSRRVMEFVANKITGLSEESRKFIKENPDLAMSYIKGEMGAEDIISKIQKEFNDIVGEKKKVGEFYEFMKNNENVSVKTSGIVSEVKGMLKDLGIKINKSGNLEFGKLSYSPAQQRQIQQVYGYINALQDLGDTASVKDVRRARQLIDGLANWEGNSRQGLDAEVMNSIRSMRGKVDDALKEQVKGFKEADGEYKALLTSIKELKRDWFNKDGTVKDNIGSKVRNLTNKANEKKLERLEKYIPDIRQNAQALGVAEAVDKATKLNVGQYLQQGLMGGGLMALLSGNITGKAIFSFLGLLGVATPKNFVRVLAKIGKGQEWVKNVGDKIMNGLKLSKEQEESVIRLLDSNKEEIMANPEKYIDLIEEGEYAKGQSKAYLGAESTEKKLSEKERASLLKKYAEGSKNNGFVMDVVKNMGEGEHGMADLDRKLIKLEENFGDTTAQHEFFHALFSVVDENTKNYVLDEAKRYLGLTDDKYSKLPKEKAEEIMNKAAEERLAESFGVYARRKEIKLGEIRLKGNRLQRFSSKVRDLFQRAYEWIQNYSIDKKTINKLFNEVYGAVDGKVLDETGKFNLAEKLGINEKSSKLGGLEGEGLRYKKTGNLKKNDYTTTNGQEDRLLLGGLAATEGGMKQATHAEGGLGNRGPQNAHLERVSSSDTANFFEHTDNKGRGYIEYNNGGGKVEKLYKQHELFDGYSEKLNKGLNKYKENLVKINDELASNTSKKTSAVIGKTGHGKDIMISKEGLSHIYKHGNLDFNTLINAINDPTNQKQEIMGGRYRLEVRLDDGDTLVVGLQPKERVKGGKVKDVNSRVDADLYTVTSVTKGKPRGAESLEVRLKRDATGRELSKGQQEYFKDSKVRDVNGGLLRMFHGTPNKGINVFEKSKIGTSTDSGVWGRGFYFTPDESYAEKYTKRNGNVGEIKEAYIDIKKPFEIDLNDKATIDKFNESYMKYSPNLEDVWKKGLQKKYGELIDQGYEKGTQDLKDAGYDGVIVKRGGEIKEVVAFEPNQIKNIDNLNPSISDDIRYKKTGKGEGVDYNSTNLYGKIDQNGLTKKEGGSFGKLGAKGLSQGNGLDRGANKGVLQETSLTKLGASKGGDGTSQKLVKVKDGSEMVKISQNLQNKQERGAFMDVHSAEEYNTYKNFTNKNKSATISVKPDGDIINFVSTEKGAGKDLMLRAIEEGGNKMDNYGVGLTSYYENFGFEPVARVKFNKEYAPNNWNFVRDGEPDIFVMKHNGDSVDVVREKYGTYKHKTPEELDKLPVMEYDDALKYRDELQAKEGKGLRYKKAYHGSPADFDKFDSSHMSEGEGHQAHGWGHYVAVNKDTAKLEYADMNKEMKYTYNGKTSAQMINSSDKLSIKDQVAKDVLFDVSYQNNRYPTLDDAIKHNEEVYKARIENLHNGDFSKQYISRHENTLNEKLNELKTIKNDIKKEFDSNLYEVEIPDPVKKDTPTGSNYLEEKGELSKKEIDNFRKIFNDDLRERFDDYGVKMMEYRGNNGKGMYEFLERSLGSDKEASKYLEKLGYDGIHYFGGRDGEAYVIFNDDSAKIQNHIRYKKDSTGRDLSKGQQEYFKDSKITDGKGKLLKVYHGTHNDFTVFDRNRIGETTNNKGIFGEGFYMTSKEGFANMYAGKGYSKEGLEGKVMEGYVNIKKPFMWNNYKGEEALANLRKELGLGKNVIELNRLDNMIHPLTKPGQSEKFRAALEKAGYDGVVFKYPKGGGDEIVAFNSNQFKNIDNLNPTKSEDVRYKKDSTDKRKDSYKMGLSRKAGNKLWEESINPSTGKKWTKEEIDKAVLDFKDEVLGDEKKLKQVYNEYIKNDELGEDVRDVFDIKGYINPDAVRPVVNRMLSEKYGVSDNILASVNHPASSKIADGIRDMIYDKSIEKAKKGEKVVVSTISGGGGSGKSKGPKALIKNGYIKDGKVDITLDVQKGADDLKLLIDKARKEGVLDKYEFDVAYVYAPVEDASKGVGIRTANQNAKGLGGLGKVFDVDRIIKELGWGDEELDRVYKGRSLPMSVFEEGHKKSAGEKGLQGFVKMSEEMDNFNLIITKRNGKGVDVVNVKKGGEFLIDKKELTKLVDEINTNKNGGINMDRINKDMEKLYKEGRISRRQYMNLISGLGLFVIFFGGGSEE